MHSRRALRCYSPPRYLGGLSRRVMACTLGVHSAVTARPGSRVNACSRPSTLSPLKKSPQSVYSVHERPRLAHSSESKQPCPPPPAPLKDAFEPTFLTIKLSTSTTTGGQNMQHGKSASVNIHMPGNISQQPHAREYQHVDVCLRVSARVCQVSAKSAR